MNWKNKPDETGLVPPDDDRYISGSLSDWICPHCGQKGGTEITDTWRPVNGVIAIECRNCEFLEM